MGIKAFKVRMFEKQIVIDGKQHLIGRLAAVVAKELLNGQRVVVVRAEDVIKSGPLYKNKMKYCEWLKLKSNTNPRHGGPYHFRPLLNCSGESLEEWLDIRLLEAPPLWKDLE